MYSTTTHDTSGGYQWSAAAVCRTIRGAAETTERKRAWHHGVSTMGVPVVDAQRSWHTCVGPCTTGDQVWSATTLFPGRLGQQSRRCWSCKGSSPAQWAACTPPAALWDHRAGSTVLHRTACRTLCWQCSAHHSSRGTSGSVPVSGAHEVGWCTPGLTGVQVCAALMRQASEIYPDVGNIHGAAYARLVSATVANAPQLGVPAQVMSVSIENLPSNVCFSGRSTHGNKGCAILWVDRCHPSSYEDRTACLVLKVTTTLRRRMEAGQATIGSTAE